MKVCITNGLQPVLWEAGLEGLYTPRLVPRLGYCEFSCSLCGQVCPTGAIPHLPLPLKKTTVLGVAAINRTLLHPLYRRDRLSGVRRTLPRLAQSHHLQRAGNHEPPGRAGPNQTTAGDPGALHRLWQLRARLPRGRRRRHPGEKVLASRNLAGQFMQRLYPEQPLVGVGAVIFRGDEVLLVRRGQEPARDSGACPEGWWRWERPWRRRSPGNCKKKPA